MSIHAQPGSEFPGVPPLFFLFLLGGGQMKVSRRYQFGWQDRRDDDTPVLLENLDSFVNLNVKDIQRILAEGYPFVHGHFRDLELLHF
jgi:hypothetical protein